MQQDSSIEKFRRFEVLTMIVLLVCSVMFSASTALSAGSPDPSVKLISAWHFTIDQGVKIVQKVEAKIDEDVYNGKKQDVFVRNSVKTIGISYSTVSLYGHKWEHVISFISFISVVKYKLTIIGNTYREKYGSKTYDTMGITKIKYLVPSDFQ
jgi:hypothetical protein